MAFDAAADTADVFGFGEIHFEEEPAAGSEGKEVFVRRAGEELHGAEGMVHGRGVFDGESGLGDDLWGFVAELAAIVLAELMTAAVAMEVAIGADVHNEIEAVEAAAETTEKVVVLRAGADGGIDDFLAEGGMGDGPFVEGAEGPVGDGVEERGGDLGGGFRGFEEIDVGDLFWAGGGRSGGEVLLGPEAEIGGGLGEMGVGVAVFGEGGGEGGFGSSGR